VRDWSRRGLLCAGTGFLWSWARRGQPSGSISVRVEAEAVILVFRSRAWAETDWKPIEQRVPIVWTECHLGGRRPWFRCSVYSGGRRCGRRVALLYGAGELFACRHCYGLAYASQQQSPRDRSLSQAQKIRMRLGGTASILVPFPEKPRQMHWRTYLSLRGRAQAAEAVSLDLTMQYLARLNRSLK
jgi:hypothetical protein